MLAVISPAKTLDFESSIAFETTQPRLKKHANELISVLREKDANEVKQLMNLSDQLATLNVERYRAFKKAHTEHNSKAALFAFKGDVYIGLDAETLAEDEVSYAQNHLRILSGLYGILRPLDVIQPYRLEMGTKLTVHEYKNLYQYWGDKITKVINRDLKALGNRTLVNLASQEYFKAVDKKALKADVIEVEFLDFHQGEFKVISFFAKKARGLISRFMTQNQINNVKDLREFDSEGYLFDTKRSSEQRLVFLRHKQS